MSTRILPLPLFILTLILLSCFGNSCRAAGEPAAAPEADAIPTRASISYPPYLLDADAIYANLTTRDVLAEGYVELHAPEGDFTADTLRYNFTSRSGRLEGAQGRLDRFLFRAQSLALEPDRTKRILGASLTTCVEPHPHYRLLAQELAVTPDNRYMARRVTLEFAGKRLLTLPRLRGHLGGEETAGGPPALIFGATGIDGMYLGTEYRYPLSLSADAAFAVRMGTQKLLRGTIGVAQRFAIPHLAGGVIAVKYSLREDAPNRIRMFNPNDSVRLQELTISRVPAVQVAFDPLSLSAPLRGFTVRMGASAGRYREEPTGVTDNREQCWAILRTPAYRLGSARLTGEVGLQNAFSNGDSHRLAITQLTLQSPPDANLYYQLAYVQRGERGVTPFLFDRIAIPREIYTETELPIAGHGHWRLGVSNRFDLERQRSRALELTAIYREDCLSYGLTYNTVDKGISMGVVVNAFGSFRKRAGAISFTQ